MEHDTLVHLPTDKWEGLEEAFEADGNRGATGFNSLKYVKLIKDKGLDIDFDVYCPNGDVRSGMVAKTVQETLYQLLVLCPTSDTRALEQALLNTKVIDWRKEITILFVPKHVQEVLLRVAGQFQIPISLHGCESYIIRRSSQAMDVSLPSEVTFGTVSLEHAEFINSVWPHRYPGSVSMFQFGIKAGLGYGLFVNNQLVAWMFIRDVGFLTHLYTVEGFRRKGYAELLVKLVTNEVLKQNGHAISFCVYGNHRSCNLFKKLEFERFEDVAFTFLNMENEA